MSPVAGGGADGGTDTIVVGGGIVGICTALYLQRTGRTVTIVERHEPGAGASGHNGGIFAVDECVPTGTPEVIRSVPRMLRDPASPLSIQWRHLPRLGPWLGRFALASRSSRVEEIAGALQSLTAPAIGAYQPLVEGTDAADLIHQGGMVFAYQDADAFAASAPIRELRARHGVTFDVLDADGLAAFDPTLGGGQFSHGVHMREWRFTSDPGELGRRLVAQFVRAGGVVRCAEVGGFEQRGGRVEAVVTAHERIPAGSVVIAAGAWSHLLARQLGFHVPLTAERGYGVDLPLPSIQLRVPVLLADVHVGVRNHGTGIRLLGMDELAGVDAPPRFGLTDRLLRLARRAFPELRTDGANPWMHSRPSLPDSLPVIGPVPRVDNAFVAFGHGHKGLALAAITGQLVQQLADGQDPAVDLTPYRPTRFGWRRQRQHAASARTAPVSQP
jgi:glycine/D-amino acid oxidase-like deaminating enzyme